jgi:hypothetical protein
MAIALGRGVTPATDTRALLSVQDPGAIEPRRTGRQLSCGKYDRKHERTCQEADHGAPQFTPHPRYSPSKVQQRARMAWPGAEPSGYEGRREPLMPDRDGTPGERPRHQRLLFTWTSPHEFGRGERLKKCEYDVVAGLQPRLSLCCRRHTEHVADSTNCPDGRGTIGQLATNSADVYVERAIETGRFPLADHHHQLVARHDSASVRTSPARSRRRCALRANRSRS